MSAAELTAEMRKANEGLRRCKCGSNVRIHYTPGATIVWCLREGEAVASLPDWAPTELARQWNKQHSKTVA